MFVLSFALLLSLSLPAYSPIDAALGVFNQFFRGMAFEFTRRDDTESNPRDQSQSLPWRGLLRYRVRVGPSLWGHEFVCVVCFMIIPY